MYEVSRYAPGKSSSETETIRVFTADRAQAIEIAERHIATQRKGFKASITRISAPRQIFTQYQGLAISVTIKLEGK